MGLQFGIKEVYDTLVSNFNTNEPISWVEYAQATTNENSAERIDIKGGQGNKKWMSFDHSKTSTFKMTIPMVDLKLLALLAGKDLASTPISKMLKREILTIGAGNTATLSSTPVGDVQVFAHLGNRDFGDEFEKVAVVASAGEYSISGTLLTFDASEVGNKVVVLYRYDGGAGKKITITANSFPPAVKIVGKGLWRDEETQQDKAVLVEVHKARPQPNYTLTNSATDATTLEITFDVYAFVNEDDTEAYIDYTVLD